VGPDAAAGYNRGNMLYRKGNYRDAILEYNKVLATGVANGHLYYNLGNAYYKSGKLGRAIIAYERAQQLLPGDEDIKANLLFANAVKKDRDPEGEVGLLLRAVDSLYGSLTEHRLTILDSLFLFLLIGAGTCLIWFDSRRVLWICLVSLLGLGFGGTTLLLANRIGARTSNSHAVVLPDALMGRSGPGEDFLQVFEIHEGTKVSIQRVEEGWMLIRLSNGVGGWVPLGGLEAI
jgi:hypothetical protein